MSGVIKSVGKIFKRVASSASKILPVALATGAVLFTAGNALGVTSSWGDAVKGVTESLGTGSTLSNVISGAVTNGGYGALAGAATSAISGGDVTQGAQYGAATGAVLGGAKGVYDSYAASPATAATSAGAPSVGTTGEVAPPPSDASGSRTGLLNSNAPEAKPPTPASPSNIATGAAASSPAPTTNAGILDRGGWLERNGTLVGNTVAGLGKGLMAADGDAQAKALEQRAEIARTNYGSPRVGLLTASNGGPRPQAAQEARMTPRQRFSLAGVQGQYVFDPASNRYVLVQPQQTTG
jgi:hypothetical protein